MIFGCTYVCGTVSYDPAGMEPADLRPCTGTIAASGGSRSGWPNQTRKCRVRQSSRPDSGAPWTSVRARGRPTGSVGSHSICDRRRGRLELERVRQHTSPTGCRKRHPRALRVDRSPRYESPRGPAPVVAQPRGGTCESCPLHGRRVRRQRSAPWPNSARPVLARSLEVASIRAAAIPPSGRLSPSDRSGHARGPAGRGRAPMQRGCSRRSPRPGLT